MVLMGTAIEVAVSRQEVRSAWAQSDQEKIETNTLGILDACSLVVTDWWRLPLTAEILANLRVIGGGPDDQWARLSRGTFRVSSCPAPASGAMRSSKITLVGVRDDRRQTVLIDGNKHAVAVFHDVQAGAPVPENSLLYVGHAR